MEILLMVVFIAIFGLWMRSSEPVAKPKEAPCDLHNWTYNHKDELQCTRCNYIAGGEIENDASF